MDHDDSIDPVTRQSLRVLADSTKQASGNQRTAQRIAQAAESGRRADYLLAEASFNALSPDQRQVIGSKAKERAEEVAFELRNTERGDLHHRGDMAAGSGSGVDWGRTVRGRSKDPRRPKLGLARDP